MATLICSHRGNSGHYPENTLVALESAAGLPAPLMEIDVRRTADGHLVLMHDDTVDRTTSGTGRVTELTLAEVRALDAGSWMSPRFAREKVPTLEEALTLCRERGKTLVIEIKQQGIVGEAMALLERCGMTTGSVVIAFDFDTVAEARRLNPGVAAGWLTGDFGGNVEATITRLLEANIPAVSAAYDCLTPEIVERCRLRGLTVHAWTIDDVPTMLQMAAMGVDVVGSNEPEAMCRGLGLS